MVPRDSVGLQNQNQATPVVDDRLKEAFLQGKEREVAKLFRGMLQRRAPLALYEAMAEELERL